MKNKQYVYVFIALTLAYIGLSLFLPSDPEVLKKYELTQAQARLLGLTVVLPLVAVWMSALYGFLRFKNYAHLVGDSTEGPPLKALADGLGVLAFSLPVGGIVGALFNYLSINSPDLLPVMTILRNYLSLLLALLAFLLIYRGAQGLLMTFKSKASAYLALPKYSVIALVVLTSLFTWLIVAQPLGTAGDQSIYQLPNWLVVLTLVVPYVYAWYGGALAAYRLYLYKGKVKGLIYKRAFNDLASGVAVIVVLSILIQFLATISARLNRLELTPILLIIFLLVALYAVGFGLVARGAKKLKKIEEA